MDNKQKAPQRELTQTQKDLIKNFQMEIQNPSTCPHTCLSLLMQIEAIENGEWSDLQVENVLAMRTL